MSKGQESLCLRLAMSFALLCAAVLLAPQEAGAEEARQFVVTSTSDANDAVPGDGKCAASDGSCTFRAALQEMAASGPATVTFAMSGSSTAVIKTWEQLPPVTDGATIDGRDPADLTKPGIVLDGPKEDPYPMLVSNLSPPPGMEGLVLGSNIVVQGLSIVDYGTPVTIAGNATSVSDSFVGLRRHPTTTGGAQENFNYDGIYVIGDNNIIERNVLSNNISFGLKIGPTGDRNVVRGNLIGTDPTGTSAIPNQRDGVVIEGGDHNVIGGTSPDARNVISGNGWRSLQVTFPWDKPHEYSNDPIGNVIVGNLIGTDISGTQDLGNAEGMRLRRAFDTIIRSNTIVHPSRAGAAIQVEGAQRNVVGGVAPGDGNYIRSGGTGVVITAAGVSVLGNSIDAFWFGIDIEGNGRTPNRQAEDEWRQHQFFPTLQAAGTTGSVLKLVGEVSSAPSSPVRIEVFAGECSGTSLDGERYLGSLDVTTDASGNAGFSSDLAAEVHVGEGVTTTATNFEGHTSEFSDCTLIEAVTGKADLGIALAGPAEARVAETVELVATVTNNGSERAWNSDLKLTIPRDLMLARSVESCTQSGSELSCALGQLPSGATRTVAVQLVPQKAGRFEVVATVASDGSDLDPGDNRSSYVLKAKR